MRAVRRTEEGIIVADVAPPARPGVRIKVHASGICGSDLHLVALGPLPVTLGHEFSGTTEDGRAVTVRPYEACGRCAACRDGRRQQCDLVFATLYGVAVDGGMADEVVVDPQCVVPLPEGLSLRDASLVEPVAVALHAVHRAGVEPGQRVLVVGCGPIGLCAIAAARYLGATVDAADEHRPERQAVAERLGAGALPDWGDLDYDVVIDAAGTQGSAERAVAAAARGGTIGLVGTHWTPVAMPALLQMKEVSVVPAITYGVHHGVDEFVTAAELVTATPELPGALLTHQFRLDDAAEAFAVAADPGSGAIKVTLVP